MCGCVSVWHNNTLQLGHICRPPLLLVRKDDNDKAGTGGLQRKVQRWECGISLLPKETFLPYSRGKEFKCQEDLSSPTPGRRPGSKWPPHTCSLHTRLSPPAWNISLFNTDMAVEVKWCFHVYHVTTGDDRLLTYTYASRTLSLTEKSQRNTLWTEANYLNFITAPTPTFVVAF